MNWLVNSLTAVTKHRIDRIEKKGGSVMGGQMHQALLQKTRAEIKHAK